MLNLISFTGADDATDIAKLVELDQLSTVPIEWALLILHEKEGQPRNPTPDTRKRIRKAVKHTAAHLCGELAFKQLAQEAQYRSGPTPLLTELSEYDRVQVNINARKQVFSPGSVHKIYEILHYRGIKTIFQYHDDAAEGIDLFMEQFPDKLHHILFDASKGKGVSPSEWPIPFHIDYCGYAGGIGPDNAAVVHAAVQAKYDALGLSDQPYWLDMESGIRFNNKFDPARCMIVADALGGLQ